MRKWIVVAAGTACAIVATVAAAVLIPRYLDRGLLTPREREPEYLEGLVSGVLTPEKRAALKRFVGKPEGAGRIWEVVLQLIDAGADESPFATGTTGLLGTWRSSEGTQRGWWHILPVRSTGSQPHEMIAPLQERWFAAIAEMLPDMTPEEFRAPAYPWIRMRVVSLREAVRLVGLPESVLGLGTVGAVRDPYACVVECRE